MNLLINGEHQQIEDEMTLRDYLQSIGVDPRTVACELNELIIKRNEYSVTHIKENDRLEIINFVGGGS